jgi:hypothetical protein
VLFGLLTIVRNKMALKSDPSAVLGPDPLPYTENPVSVVVQSRRSEGKTWPHGDSTHEALASSLVVALQQISHVRLKTISSNHSKG